MKELKTFNNLEKNSAKHRFLHLGKTLVMSKPWLKGTIKEKLIVLGSYIHEKVFLLLHQHGEIQEGKTLKQENNKTRTAKVGDISKAQNCKRGDPSGFETPAGCKSWKKIEGEPFGDLKEFPKKI